MELNFPEIQTGSLFGDPKKRKTHTEVELDNALEEQSFQDLESPDDATPIENLGQLLSPKATTPTLVEAKNSSSLYEKRPGLLPDSSDDESEEEQEESKNRL